MKRHSQSHISPVAQIHRANILKRLEHRLEVARAKGEIHLISQLEAERQYYSH